MPPCSATCITISFFSNATATTEPHPLSLHDALPISLDDRVPQAHHDVAAARCARDLEPEVPGRERTAQRRRDRKSTRLNSSHANISYAVFCLKKKNLHECLEERARERKGEGTVQRRG